MIFSPLLLYIYFRNTRKWGVALFIFELLLHWPLKKASWIPTALLFGNDGFELAFSSVWKRQGLQKPWTKLGFLTRALLFEGGLSDQISFTSVVMELGVFWKTSLSSLFSPRVLAEFGRAALSSFRCVCFDLWMYEVMVVFYLFGNVMDLNWCLRLFFPSPIT